VTVQDRIEKEIVIEAPPEVVWRVVTQPAHIECWFSDSAEFELRPGAEGTLTWGDKATTSPTTVRLKIEEVDELRYFAFRWDYLEHEQAVEANSLLVEFSLTPEGPNTRLRLVESGFAALERPDADNERYIEHHTQGWAAHLVRLTGCVVKERGRSPVR
jgi:uncharacterized protein YndB with AHSA1/START domain